MAKAPTPAAGEGAHGKNGKVEMHLPHGSWWPFWLANGMALVGFALITFGNQLRKTLSLDALGEEVFDFAAVPFWSYLFMVAAVAFLVFTLIGWFRQDYFWWQTNTGTGLHIPKAGTLLFISSEIFLFGALFSAYFSYKLAAHEWPDTHVELPLLKTGFFSLFLFASSATIHKAEALLKKGDKKGFDRWWLATIVLGAIFLAGQVSEYATLILEGATLGSGHFMTSFFMLTGTHGLHVFGGLCFLVIVHVRSRKGQFDQVRHAAPQTAALYWHFVDIVWIFVFSILYLLNA